MLVKNYCFSISVQNHSFNLVDVIFRENEVGTQPVEDFLDHAVGDEIPLAWCHENPERPILKTEHRDGDHHRHGQDAKQHPSELL